MKLRIRGNSIRLRLGKSEVARLVEGGRISESIQFSASPGSLLTYTVMTSPVAKEITACFVDNEIKIVMPEGLGKSWADSEQVELKRVHQITSDVTVSISVEKDFQCLAPRSGEDESDNFANPAGKKPCNLA